MKIYDFDGMFDEKLSAYIAKNPKKYSESEWEDVIPALYQKFGDTPIKSLGKSPREFYGDMTDDELIKSVKTHIKQGVTVSEFLCDAVENRQIFDKIMPLLDGSGGERNFAMQILGADERALKKYLQILVESDDEETKNLCADLIKEKADCVTLEVLNNYKDGLDSGYMLEIMSRTVIKNDEVFNILLKEFRTDPENLVRNTGYLAAYGDERALKYLLDKIEEDGISFVEYRELKFAIESLGGEYNKERDFSFDPYYSIIKSHDGTADIFNDNKE